MATKKPTKKAAKAAKKPAKKSVFSAEEREAMREYAREKRGGSAPDEGAVVAKIRAMPAADRAIGERLHAIIRAAAPTLEPKLWYGMPAYAIGGKVVCFYQNAGKFKARYGHLGFSDKAKLDDGAMWPIAFGLTQIGPDEEARITALVQKAVG